MGLAAHPDARIIGIHSASETPESEATDITRNLFALLLVSKMSQFMTISKTPNTSSNFTCFRLVSTLFPNGPAKTGQGKNQSIFLIWVGTGWVQAFCELPNKKTQMFQYLPGYTKRLRGC